ncbi:MAG: oxygen-dependent coproporphyrinogen oxidase [Gemmataceae bacterium]
MRSDDGQRAAELFRQMQDTIMEGLETLDGGTFREDRWDRPEGGGGRSRVLSEGNVFEKAGVNFSEVFGTLDPNFAKQLPGDGLEFYATGVSLVLHPRNPHIPTVHANFRYLQRGSLAWFGGGADLTPYYPVLEDVQHFHRTWQSVCQAHGNVVDYAQLKAECDRYFYLPHRNEARGVGGIFFDNLLKPRAFEFVAACGAAFLPSYLPIVERRQGTPYSAAERRFQEYRRGRYVEFNLVYDRGTLFGLRTNGRIESILMSLPPVVRYEYDYRPEAGSREAALTGFWLKPRDWANESLSAEQMPRHPSSGADAAGE